MFDNEFLASSKKIKPFPKDYIFSTQTGEHMWLQSPVFYIQCIDTWRHHYESMFINHKINNGLSEEEFIFQNPGW